MSKNKFISLIKLIDEPDAELYDAVEEQIISQGVSILPFLRDAAHMYLQDYVQERIQKIVRKIIVEHIARELDKWRSTGKQDLLDALYLLSLQKYPFLNKVQIKEIISELKISIWLELNERLTLLEKIHVFNRVLFQIYEFKPTTKRNFYDVENYNLYDVLRNRVGSPVLLCSLYIILAKELDLPIFGVNIPEYFICVAVNDEQHKTIPFMPAGEPLFYINVFSYGTLFTRAQLSAFLEQFHVSENPSYYRPCSNADIVFRILQTLIHVFKINNDMISMQEIQQISFRVFGE